LFCTAAWYHLVRAWLTGPESRRREPWWIGVHLGLALASKASTVFLLPIVLLWALSSWRRPRRSLAHLTISFGVALLLAGGWYLRNWIHYGDPFQMRSVFETFSSAARFSPMGGPEWETLLQGTLESFFGFWHSEILLPAPLLIGFLFATGVTVAGLLAALTRARRQRVPENLRRLFGPALLAWTTMCGLIVAGNLGIPSPQGRYLYPALGPLLILVAIGWFALFAPAGTSRWWWLLPPALAACTLWSFGEVVLEREATDRSRAIGRGGVLFYEDGG
jgi:4-amino-4-deoxy-L-arabinose transferase-like glycosyltransferase